MESVVVGGLTTRLYAHGLASSSCLRKGLLRGAYPCDSGSLNGRNWARDRSLATRAICALRLRRRSSSSHLLPLILPSEEIRTAAAAAILPAVTSPVKGTHRVSFWRRRNDKVWSVNSCNAEPTQENLEEKSASGSADNSGPPFLTIVAGLLVLGVIIWALSSVLFWAVGKVYVWVVGVLLS